jgi:hypothetical protein
VLQKTLSDFLDDMGEEENKINFDPYIPCPIVLFLEIQKLGTDRLENNLTARTIEKRESKNKQETYRLRYHVRKKDKASKYYDTIIWAHGLTTPLEVFLF